jgi:hypothetical protein
MMRRECKGWSGKAKHTKKPRRVESHINKTREQQLIWRVGHES